MMKGQRMICSFFLGGYMKGKRQEAILDLVKKYEIETQEELAELIRRNTRTDYGQIIDLIPVQRGKSGRICKLKIVGTKKTLTIGKELEIRRILSESHLKSSAFDVRFEDDRVMLEGKGWGHGAGLCQIGAAVMASRGYGYKEILEPVSYTHLTLPTSDRV